MQTFCIGTLRYIYLFPVLFHKNFKAANMMGQILRER